MLRIDEDTPPSPDDRALLDGIAALTQRPDDLRALRELYTNPELRVPDSVLNFQTGALEAIPPG